MADSPRSLAVAAAVFASLALPQARAFAKTVKVPDAIAGITTIQQALDVASAGDVISIAPGEYRENLALADVPNLRITGKGGKGGVVIDARPLGATGSGPGIHLVNCDGVEIESITVRNASGAGPAGAGIRIEASDGAVLDGVAMLGCDEQGAIVQGDLVKVLGCRFEGNKFALEITGDGALVKKTVVRNDRLRGIGITGDDATVTQCDVDVVRISGGIHVVGERPTVTACDVRGVMDADAAGITTTGSNPVIRKNDVSDSDIGLLIAYGALGIIEKNVATRCSSNGFKIGNVSHDLLLRKNVALRCSTGGAPAFLVDGDAEVLEDNVAEGCGGDGFAVISSNCVLRRNRAIGNLRDGFDVAALVTNVTLDANRAEKNGAEGFENSGDATVLTDNRATKNRLDFANDGTVATASGNDFAVAGAPAPEID